MYLFADLCSTQTQWSNGVIVTPSSRVFEMSRDNDSMMNSFKEENEEEEMNDSEFNSSQLEASSQETFS